MADLNRLAKLFQAVAAQDWASARSVASEIAVAEDEIGHHVAAQRLRGALSPNGAASKHGAREEGGITNGSGYFLSSALSQVPADHGLDELVLKPSARAALLQLHAEWTSREKLAARQIERRSKLIFHGPPGCGKSATARAIGREMGLPVFVVRFDAVVGAYLGQTALHLRQLFNFAETTPSVLLIDEIDALGKRRGSPLDVGELDRVVIALLQELEHSRPAGLLIATSNLAKQLDDALWRRFDLSVEFPRPSADTLRGFASRLAKQRGVKITKAVRAALGQARTFADSKKIIESEERRLVIEVR